MIITSEEAREKARKNIGKQNEFLSGERKAGLNRLFGGKGAGGKLKIEIGLQELKIAQKAKKKTRTGGDMIVLSFYKHPKESSMRKTKESYSPINCYHMLRDTGSGEFDKIWFQSFTTGLTEGDFKDINKGDTFLCVVKHVEKLFEKDGEIVTYSKGFRFGKPIIIVEPHIVAIYPLGTENIEIQYFTLYEPLKQ